MAGYNRIIIVGNLTRDPDFKQLPSGQAVCRLSLASNRQFKNRQTGTMGQDVCYVDIDVWGPQADTCRQYLAKGRPILVEGRLKFDTWQDQQGATRSKHSIAADRVVFLSSGAAEGLATTSELGEQEPEQATYSTNKTEEFIKIEQAVAKKQAAKKVAMPVKKDKEVGGAPEFKDEPPFDDELPF